MLWMAKIGKDRQTPKQYLFFSMATTFPEFLGVSHCAQETLFRWPTVRRTQWLDGEKRHACGAYFAVKVFRKKGSMLAPFDSQWSLSRLHFVPPLWRDDLGKTSAPPLTLLVSWQVQGVSACIRVKDISTRHAVPVWGSDSFSDSQRFSVHDSVVTPWETLRVTLIPWGTPLMT